MSKLSSWEFLALSLCIAFAAHLMPGSTYSTPEMMNAYFGGENTPGSWTWEGVDGSWTKDFEPFKYRIFFRGLVDSLANLFLVFGADRNLQTYWGAYLTISIAAQTFAIYACYLFLQALGLKTIGRLVGLAAWLTLPPILFPYAYPIQTKEDFVAYGLIFLALRAMLTGAWLQVVLICFFGAFVRETLLFIAGIFLIGTDAPRRAKIAALLLPIIVHIILRATMGMDGYEVFRVSNLDSPLLPFAAFALAFGYGWVPLVIYMSHTHLLTPIKRAAQLLPGVKQESPITTITQRLEALRQAFPYALVLLITAHFFMGRVQEIRVTCLLSPFVLLALVALFRDKQLSMRSVLMAWTASCSAAVLLVAFEMTGSGTALRDALNPMLAEFAQPLWWMVAYFQLVLIVGVLTAYFSVQQTHSAEVEANLSRAR